MFVRLLLIVSLLLFSAACSDSRGEPDAAEPPAAAAEEPVEGVFTARIPDGEFEQFSYLPDHFGGRWTITVSEDEYVLEGPIFRVTEDILQTVEETWDIDATPAPVGAFNCFNEEGERMTGPGEATGLYEVSLKEDELTLSPIEEPCELRALFLDRTWSRQ